MKRISMLLVAAMMCLLVLPLCGCGGSGETAEEVIKAKITRTDGVEEELSIDELYAIRDENSAKFKKYYIGAAVEITAPVCSVGTSSVYLINDVICDSWVVTNKKGNGLSAFAPDFCGIALEDLSKGDKMYVKSIMYDMNNSGAQLMNPTEFYKVD